MLRVILVATLLVSFLAQAETQGMKRTFKLALFETEKACKEAQNDSGRWFNCYMTLSLYDNGQASVMVTDIKNPATYVLDGDRLSVTLLNPVDAPPKMYFRLTRNMRNLVDEDLQVWEWRDSD